MAPVFRATELEKIGLLGRHTYRPALLPRMFFNSPSAWNTFCCDAFFAFSAAPCKDSPFRLPIRPFRLYFFTPPLGRSPRHAIVCKRHPPGSLTRPTSQTPEAHHGLRISLRRGLARAFSCFHNVSRSHVEPIFRTNILYIIRL